jgi:predicted nucleotidyltransferase
MIKANLSLQTELKQLLATQTDLELAVLVGSQANGQATLESDFDIAIRWNREVDSLDALARTETLRRLLATQLQVCEHKIDLIDMTCAKLPMKALIAEEGVILKGENSLAWQYFLQRTWRELEMFYWNKLYAA